MPLLLPKKENQNWKKKKNQKPPSSEGQRRPPLSPLTPSWPSSFCSKGRKKGRWIAARVNPVMENLFIHQKKVFIFFIFLQTLALNLSLEISNEVLKSIKEQIMSMITVKVHRCSVDGRRSFPMKLRRRRVLKRPCFICEQRRKKSRPAIGWTCLPVTRAHVCVCERVREDFFFSSSFPFLYSPIWKSSSLSLWLRLYSQNQPWSD